MTHINRYLPSDRRVPNGVRFAEDTAEEPGLQDPALDASNQASTEYENSLDAQQQAGGPHSTISSKTFTLTKRRRQLVVSRLLQTLEL